MFSVACNNEQKVKVTANPTTSSGKPAALDGPLTVTVASGDGTVGQDPAEPNSFYAISGDGVGTTVYSVSGDADLGAGVVAIEDSVQLEVSGAQAAAFGLVSGSPEDK